MSHTIAIFPGSFDPFTRGHQALVDDALRIFDKVVIGIGNNVSKAGLLRIEARKQLIEDLYADNPRVEVRIYTGLTGDFARRGTTVSGDDAEQRRLACAVTADEADAVAALDQERDAAEQHTRTEIDGDG